MKEKILDLKDYEGYKVSNFGYILNPDGSKKYCEKHRGHYRVKIGQKNATLSRLVYEAFCRPLADSTHEHIKYKDGNPLNCRLDNLYAEVRATGEDSKKKAREYNRARYVRNREVELSRQKRYYATHREERKRWRDEHKEEQRIKRIERKYGSVEKYEELMLQRQIHKAVKKRIALMEAEHMYSMCEKVKSESATMAASLTEEWKDIDGYEGIYQVSNKGQVRSLDRWVHVNGGKYLRKGKVFSCSADRYGYTVANFGHGVHYRVHRLVARAFMGASDKHVDHIDGNRSNNAVTNLRYVTPKQNAMNIIGRAKRIKSRGHRVEAIEEKTGRKAGLFNSIAEASRCLCLSASAIGSHMETGKPYSGYVFRRPEGATKP